MHLSNESLLVIIVVGIVAGWLAGNIVRGGGYGLIGDLVVGVIGAFIGDWLLPQLSIHLGTGMIALIVNATLGAIVLLIVLRLISGLGGGGWRGGAGAGSRQKHVSPRDGSPLGRGGYREPCGPTPERFLRPCDPPPLPAPTRGGGCANAINSTQMREGLARGASLLEGARDARSGAGRRRGRVAPDHGELRRRIALPGDLDARRRILDGGEIGSRQANVGRADVLLEPGELRRARDRRDPGLAARAARRARSAPASRPSRLATPLQEVDERLVLPIASGANRGTVLRKSPSPSFVSLFIAPVRKPLPSGL